MSTILFANNAKTTTQGAISDTDVTIVLKTGAGALFPALSAGQYFIATLTNSTGTTNEIVKVTARTGDSLTVVRGQESTIAVAWGTGTKFSNFWTAGQASVMLQSAQAQIQAGNYAADTGSVNAMVVTLSPVPASLASLIGTPIRVLVNITNTNATPTLNINGLGAQNCVTVGAGGVAGLSVGGCAAGKICEFVWDGTNFQYLGRVGTASTAMIQAGTDFVSPITSSNLRGAMAFVTIGVTGNYQFLPTGVLMQWGTVTSTTGANDQVNFPTTFPNAIVAITITGNTAGGFLNACALGASGGHTPTTASFWFGTGQLSAAVPPAVGGVLCRWIAFGY